MTVTVTRSDDVSLPVTLRRDGATLDISTATDVTAALTSREGTPTSYVQASQSSGTPGADWTKSLVVLVFAAATTGSLPNAGIRLEIQVTLGGKKTTWYTDAIQSRIGAIA